MAAPVFLSLGHGYCAQYLAPYLLAQGRRIIGTGRDAHKVGQHIQNGVTGVQWPGHDLTPLLHEADHILISIAPDAQGDLIFNHYRDVLATIRPKWVGYLSTTGVYGNHNGAWVDEATPLTPGTIRGQWRVLAERQWQTLAQDHGLPLHIFRLAGIYGPGRGPFEKLRTGRAQRIIKENQFFSRIHAEDIAQTLYASLMAPNPGAVYNVCDDDPSPPEDVLAYGAQLLNLPVPPAITLEEANLGPLGRSFYDESKKVSNRKIKRELNITLKYPTYREGLQALLAQEQARHKGQA